MSYSKFFARFAVAPLILVIFAAPLFGSDAPVEKPETPVSSPSATRELPPYDFPYHGGLFASAAGFIGVKNVCFPCQKDVILDVDGICGKFHVKAGIQDAPAPLVIMLLGVGGRADADFAKLWPSWYYEQGYHVLTFDSTFLQDFNAKTHLGVGGNVWAETEYCVKIIDAFLKQSSVSGRVTQIGLVGMSYGGVQALMIGTMAVSKKLPFEVAAIQSWSPPIHIEQSARIIDGWYAETYGKYTLVELAKLEKMKIDPSNPDSPILEDKLKAAVATSFRYTLPSLVAYSDLEYHLNKLPKGDEFNDKYVRLDYASKWTFVGFAYSMSYPYWQSKLGLENLEPLIHAADLPALIEKQPPFSEVILAEDDPLDSATDMAAFKTFAASKRVTILPSGGHLGYVAVPWTKAKLMTLFDAMPAK